MIGGKSDKENRFTVSGVLILRPDDTKRLVAFIKKFVPALIKGKA